MVRCGDTQRLRVCEHKKLWGLQHRLRSRSVPVVLVISVPHCESHWGSLLIHPLESTMRFSVMKSVDTLTSERDVEVPSGEWSADQAAGSHGHSLRVANAGAPALLYS